MAVKAAKCRLPLDDEQLQKLVFEQKIIIA